MKMTTRSPETASAGKEVNVYRIAQDRLVASRQEQFRNEADVERLVSRVHHSQPRIQRRPRHTLGLRLQLIR